MTNHAIQNIYIFEYKGDINDLKVEEGKSFGFEVWPVETILNISDEDKKKFIPSIFKPENLEIFREIEKLMK